MSSAQTKVSGIVTDKKGMPITGVNIYFQNTYDGTISGMQGEFETSTQENENIVLVARFIGYEPFQQPLDSDTVCYIRIILKESSRSIDAVTITAGSFAAGDKSKASVLKPLDIYTTAGSLGNIFGALTTLPGTQPAADDGRLLVRGGEAYETKTVIDGLLAGKPYYSKVPDVPTRGRFSPSLFSGIMFNTGGYSAEYGQALSSVLVLNSNDLATEDVLSLSLMSIGGGGVDYTNSWKNNSISVMANYTNMSPYYEMINTKRDWEKPVESFSGGVVYRHKTPKNGMLKAYFSADTRDLRYKSDTGVEDEKYTTQLTNKNYYGNVTIRQPLGEKTCIKAGASVTIDNPDIDYSTQHIKTKELNAEARVLMIHDLADGVKLKYGVSNTLTNYQQDYQAYSNSIWYKPEFRDYLSAAFVETEVKFTKHIAFRPGVRYEYSSLLNKGSLAPRLAMAFNTGKKSQISASYGQFYQNPTSDVLKFSSKLNFEKATHYILGFQSGSVDHRLFRVESYYKEYDQLVKYDQNELSVADYYNNTGDGKAIGVDVFWRDAKSVKHLDYWVSYSYIDTHRKYKDFNYSAQPDFISNHTFSMVGKYFVPAINCQFGATYWMASGRNWYENSPTGKMTHQGKLTNDLSVNVSYLTNIFNQFTIIHFSLSNVLGKSNVYGYHAGPVRDSNGDAIYLPVTNDVKQFVFVGIFITLK